MKTCIILIMRSCSLLFFLCVVTCVYGQKRAIVKKTWLEHGVTRNGEAGMVIHSEISTTNLKGQRIKVIAYFYDRNKNKLLGGISGYRASDGHTCISLEATPTYKDSYWKDFDIFMPVRAIPLAKGKHTYYVAVEVFCPGLNKFVTNTKSYVSFEGTGSTQSNNNQQNYQARNNSNSQSYQSEKRTWREDLGYGMFAINVEQHGTRSRTIYRMCPSCRGSQMCMNCMGMRQCTICQGRGGIVTSGYGRYIACTACNMTGACSICKGTGKCICTNYEYPGYVPGSTMLIGANGQVIHSDTYSYSNNGGSSSSSSSSHSSSSGGGCSKCGGTGVDPSPFFGGNPSRSSWLAYTNGSDEICPHCHRSGFHTHNRCASCNVPR